MSGYGLLSTRGLSLSFGGVVAADAIDFDLQPGERLAVVGQNGAGKTTFINICTGYLKPTSGTVLFDAVDITGHTPRAITRRGVGRSFQLPQVFTEHTVRECLMLAASSVKQKHGFFLPLAQAVDAHEVDATLDLLQLSARAHDLAGSLPEGQRKLLDVAMAMFLRPKVLLLDEPTSSVSTADKFKVMKVIFDNLKREGVSAVFVEHDMEVVKSFAHRVVKMENGRVVGEETYVKGG